MRSSGKSAKADLYADRRKNLHRKHFRSRAPQRVSTRSCRIQRPTATGPVCDDVTSGRSAALAALNRQAPPEGGRRCCARRIPSSVISRAVPAPRHRHARPESGPEALCSAKRGQDRRTSDAVVISELRDLRDTTRLSGSTNFRNFGGSRKCQGEIFVSSRRVGGIKFAQIPAQRPTSQGFARLRKAWVRLEGQLSWGACAHQVRGGGGDQKLA